jgi:hypothetical protein
VSASASLHIAIPFHRGLDYLRQAIESVRAQTRSDWTLRVWDDRGEPEAAVRALVDGFADPRIDWRANPSTLGMAGNWNRALDEAPCDLVTLLHADDRLLPAYAHTLLALAEAQAGAAALACGAELIDAHGRPTWTVADTVKHLLLPGVEPWRLRGESGLRTLLRGDFVVCPTIVWRRSRLAGRRFEPEWRQVLDVALLGRLLCDGDEIVGTRRRVYAYRRHAGSATAIQSANGLRFDEEFRLYERLAREAEARGWRTAARVGRRKTVVRAHLGFHAALDAAALRPRAARRKLVRALAGR